jgi:transposase
MRAYWQDLRDRVLHGLERGERPTEIARRLEVSRGWVYQVREDWQRAGRRSSLQIGGYRRSCLAEREPLVRAWIEQRPDLTLAEICARLAREAAVRITISALWHPLDKWGLTLKKNAARQRARARRRATGALAVAREPTRSGR